MVAVGGVAVGVVGTVDHVGGTVGYIGGKDTGEVAVRIRAAVHLAASRMTS